MFISKHTVSFSSHTASWESGKRIKRTADLNGQLLQMRVGPAGSSAKIISFYRGTTETHNLMLKTIRSKTTATIHTPRQGWVEATTGANTLKISTGTVRFPWCFADESVIIVGATQQAGVVTFWLDGTVNKSTL